MSLLIKPSSIEECYRIAQLIPEFSDGQYSLEEYHRRVEAKQHIALIAEMDGEPAGFKIGYDSEEPGTFYSWMGGVIPKFRKEGVARKLAKEQEKIAQENGYLKIRFKTRNYLKPMLIFALKNGFHIMQVESRQDISENRIILEKEL
ncbi:GNAT family N-acetyltransferase [Jiulongibacter sp. NS-SX5]|uniref:GNAT family N-acetyltransferase n=1 Tax=Jiulongibacter sp. NS-SX5 TaxID=3463854 RepID=UPI0040594D7D